ncbi:MULTISPECIES: phosphoribosyltransferase family protein [Acidianus]|uniref:Phosphoribosyltransferase n=1 Tax=Candidatus Acidianus copahuensis TaxID=1160895 RepID=A0A031LMH6_9CREN|nr:MULTISPECIES: phosphoribosyltransferase family protein [Acidianus]EZQ03075.1 phosphoribosyltransferase [Candidatus Acidianus copahuensis]NON62926.1 phosphoribosyltransferase [Acidianus sp. RZ1]
MMQQTKENELRTRLLAVNLLKELKSVYTYKELSKIINVQESLLCRYVNGVTIPSDIQSLEIINKIKNTRFLINFLTNKIKIYEDKYVDSSELLLFPSLLKLLIEVHINKIPRIKDTTKILSVATNGVPFATMISIILNKPLIIAKKHMDSIYLEYYSESLKESDSVVSKLYIRKDLLKKDDKVLVVDDVIRSGKTINAAIRLAEKSGATVIAAVVLIQAENIRVNLDNLYVIFDLK